MNIVSNIRQILIIATVAIAAISCSTTQKAIKEGDPEKIYDLAMEEYALENWNKAIQLFDYAEPYFSNSRLDDSLKFNKARCVFKSGDYEYAITLLEEYRRRYSHSPMIEDAEGMYTISYYNRAPGPKRDQSLTESAIYAIDEFTSRHPHSDNVEKFKEMREELYDRLHEKNYLNAYTYYKIGQYKSAIVAFRNANKKYPESRFREEISYYIVASSYELADNSVISKKEERFMQMMDSYYSFISEFPESKHRKEVDSMMDKARRYIDKENKRREIIADGDLEAIEELEKASKKELREEKKAEKLESKERLEKEQEIKEGLES